MVGFLWSDDLIIEIFAQVIRPFPWRKAMHGAIVLRQDHGEARMVDAASALGQVGDGVCADMFQANENVRGASVGESQAILFIAWEIDVEAEGGRGLGAFFFRLGKGGKGNPKSQ